MHAQAVDGGSASVVEGAADGSATSILTSDQPDSNVAAPQGQIDHTQPTCEAWRQKSVPLDPESHLPVPVDAPWAAISSQDIVGDELVAHVASIKVDVGRQDQTLTMLPADGLGLVPVTVQLLDGCGQLMKGRVPVRVDAGYLRIVTKSSGSAGEQAGSYTGKAALVAEDGSLRFDLVAPTSPMEVPLLIRAGSKEGKGKVSFSPDLRPLIAAGLIEGVIHLDSKGAQSITPSSGINDNFANELKSFQRQFNNGKLSTAARTAFFVKGAIKGEYLLTATFDTDKPLPGRTLQDVNPDKYYPVMGDSAVRGMEAKSSSRLYVRLDNGKNYALYGDFATGEGFSQQLGGAGVGSLKQRDLGQYNRTMTGLRVHRENEQGFLDSYVMRDTLRQAIEEYRANGTSGPFSVGNRYALENSEKIEVIVRDRNNLSRIVSVMPLVRFVDYIFEPFNGQILLKAPLASLDGDLNPVSLRITYEVDTGKDPFWLLGVAGQRHLDEQIEIGGSFMKDWNTSAPSGGVGYATTTGSATAQPREMRQLLSANVGFQLSPESKLVAELAQANSATLTGDVSGWAGRFDYAGQGVYTSPLSLETPLKYSSRVWGGESQKDFNNPAASFTNGKEEVGIKVAAELTEDTRLFLSGIHDANKASNTRRDAESVHIEKTLDDRWVVDGGVRHIYQSAGVGNSLSSSASGITLPGQAPIYGASGLNPSGAGFWGTGAAIDPVTGQPQTMLNGQVLNSGLTSPELNVWTVKGGATYALKENWHAGAEVGHDIGLASNPYWTALNTDYRHRNGRLFARYEIPTGQATAGGDYKLTESASLYGRYENIKGLVSNYALDSTTKSEAWVFGVRQANSAGMEGFSEMRMHAGMNARELENATGVRNTFDVNADLKANVSAERLKILSGTRRGASALGGGLDWSGPDWKGTARLEWRQLDPTAGVAINDTTDSWLNSLSLYKRVDEDWSALFRNYLLTTDNRSLAGNQLQNRFQAGASYRPVDTNDLDVLTRYENKYERNQELSPAELRVAHIVSVNLNQHPEREWWTMVRVAAKQVNEDLSGMPDSFSAWMLSGRVIYDLSATWDVGVMVSTLRDVKTGSNQYAYGAEIGYQVEKNVWAGVGYNLAGFSDRDLTGGDYTRSGLYLNLRMKFDETGIEKAVGVVKARFEEEQ
ncbi:MAG: hypothetical protein WCT35_09405 [Sideroxydans sp.]